MLTCMSFLETTAHSRIAARCGWKSLDGICSLVCLFGDDGSPHDVGGNRLMAFAHLYVFSGTTAHNYCTIAARYRWKKCKKRLPGDDGICSQLRMDGISPFGTHGLHNGRGGGMMRWLEKWHSIGGKVTCLHTMRGGKVYSPAHLRVALLQSISVDQGYQRK
jgi:hypothetical protein